jgi:hypothetical protein
MSLPSFHDTLRHLVRGGAFHDEEGKQAALLAIDANEKGYSDTDAYAEELRKQAAAQRAEAGQETPDERAARLEADNVRLQALVNAQTRTVPPGGSV